MKKRIIYVLGFVFTLLSGAVLSNMYSKDTIKIAPKAFATLTGVTGPIMNSNLFYNNTTWYKNKTLKDFDSLYILLNSLILKPSLQTVGGDNYSTMMDINGDGLQDLLISRVIDQNYLFSIEGYKDIKTNANMYAILLNKGNMEYEAIYRCMYYSYYNYKYNGSYVTDTNIEGYYFGDCAK